MVRITEEIKKQMIAMRESGATYPQICASLNVKKERCMAYLKDIKVNPRLVSAITNEWIRAEEEAKTILSQMGFTQIHNLNNISSTVSSWDYLVRKEDRWWLIDVTVNGQKSMAAKRDVVVDGYEHAILLKEQTGWKLIKFVMNVECEINI
jgi:hypothetical protein